VIVVTSPLLTVFLVLHGLLHLGIWVPSPRRDGPEPPFVPDRSALLTAAAVPTAAAHRLSVLLAVVAAGAYVTAGLAVAFDTAWAVPLAVAAAVTGLALKLVFFHPWLILGVLLDLAVLIAAATGWPVGWW
jgi:hypothetical protein